MRRRNGELANFNFITGLRLFYWLAGHVVDDRFSCIFIRAKFPGLKVRGLSVAIPCIFRGRGWGPYAKMKIWSVVDANRKNLNAVLFHLNVSSDV